MNGTPPKVSTVGWCVAVLSSSLSRGSFFTGRPIRGVGALLLFLSTLSGTSLGGTVDEVIAEVEKIAAEAGLKTALVGFCLIPLDAAPGSAAGYRMDTGLVPASTMKVFSTATANELLGPDYRFVTELQTTGGLDEEGTLKGDIILRGGGDPTLGATSVTELFLEWKTALMKSGVKTVEGSVVGDASLFGTILTPDTWQWNDMGNYYGAGASGLSILQNLFSCSFRTSSVGSKASFSGTEPKLPGIEFVNDMRVGSSGSGDKGFIYGDPFGKLFYLRGSVPAGSGTYTIKGALPDPAYFCARTFSEYLNGNGLSVAGEATTDRLRGIAGAKEIGVRRKIHEHSSDSLASILKVTNHKSDNLRAEAIHRLIGITAGKSGSTVDASEATYAHWAGKGIDMTGFFMGDGCGLSRSNTVTPRQMTMMLYHAARAPHFDSFEASLPVAGQSGTLRSIGAGSSAEGRIRAKSGTLDRIRNYSGYVTTRSGRRYAFTLFINNYTGDLASVKAKIVRVWTKMVAL